MNPTLYELELTPGARLLLSRLHDDVDDDPVTRAAVQRAWDERQPGALPPFAWRFAGDRCARLCKALRIGRTQVVDDLAALTRLGVIRRVQREGRWGWELLGTRPERPAEAGTPAPRGRQTDPARPPHRPPEAATPAPTTAPAEEVEARRGRHTGPPRPVHRPAEAGTPAPDLARDLVKNQENGIQTQVGEARRGPNLKITPAPSDPLTARLAALAGEIGTMFIPLDADGREQGSRRIRADPATLERLRRLLAPPAGVEIDVWVDRQVAEIRSYCTDYAAICRANGMQARWWGPAMFESTRPGVGKPSAWETLTRLVDAWRTERAVLERRRRVAADRAGQAAAEQREVAETRARVVAGDLPPDVAEGFARYTRQPQQVGLPAVLSRVARPAPRGDENRPELTEADEERVRRSGAQREAEASRAADHEQHVRARINAAFADYARVYGRTPTPEVAEEIRRRIRAEEQETGT